MSVIICVYLSAQNSRFLKASFQVILHGRLSLDFELTEDVMLSHSFRGGKKWELGNLWGFWPNFTLKLVMFNQISNVKPWSRYYLDTATLFSYSNFCLNAYSFWLNFNSNIPVIFSPDWLKISALNYEPTKGEQQRLEPVYT